MGVRLGGLGSKHPNIKVSGTKPCMWHLKRTIFGSMDPKSNASTVHSEPGSRAPQQETACLPKTRGLSTFLYRSFQK